MMSYQFFKLSMFLLMIYTMSENLVFIPLGYQKL